MNRPRNIVLIMADSLRWDSVFGGSGPQMPYVMGNSVIFNAARSAGCWTLPATASMFTGLLPHEHGADTQSRGLDIAVPTLAEALKAQGYRTHQITANVATTEIFGLDRGFDEVVRIWKEVPAQHRKLHELMVLVGKPRLRKKVLSTDWLRGKLSEDIEAGKVWLQDTVQDIFARARLTLERNERDGKPSFLFLNLMETHFPYHVSPIFAPLASGLGGAVELLGLYHLVNQTFMTTGSQPTSESTMQRIRSRQRVAWERIAPLVDAFTAELHRGTGNLVVVGSDHGECFGEMGWSYHFNNVTDAGNRVPLFWLGPGQSGAREVHHPVSARDLYSSVLAEVGSPLARHHLVHEPEASLSALESCWYNSQGLTIPEYKYNQLAFVGNGTRYLRRNGEWFGAAPSTLEGEPEFKKLGQRVDPVEELSLPGAERTRLRRLVSDFEAFSTRIS